VPLPQRIQIAVVGLLVMANTPLWFVSHNPATTLTLQTLRALDNLRFVISGITLGLLLAWLIDVACARWLSTPPKDGTKT